jgi:DNA-directed RNA polymerase subunit alpha
MESLPLPNAVTIVADTDDANKATITVEPCYPGYGTTLGNALRRVLLSSLPGAAATRVRIKGVDHEFSTVPGVKEDVVDILLNLKQLRIRIHEGENATLTLKATGEGAVKAKDIELPSNAEIMNPDFVLATLTEKDATLEMEIAAQTGRGYVPVEAQEREKTDLGSIALDAIYTPVKNVNFDSENVRVGQMTNFDKLRLTISTDGNITPAEAFRQATEIMLNHFTLLHEADLTIAKARKSKKGTKEETVEESAETPDEEMKKEE